ncbi:hypothetical protein lerEdw1_015160, partial [Lerista edwardsae]
CKEPPPLPETLENVVCALGLALGILGIVAGTILCVKARQGGEGGPRRGARQRPAGATTLDLRTAP